MTDNLRPTLERENLVPARDKIHDLFLEHVMAQAPGYDKLIDWAGAPIMPTPAAVGLIIETIAKKQGINVIGVDIGGATTDVFSVFRRHLQPDRVGQPGHELLASPMCWPRRTGEHHALGAVRDRRAGPA